jgi:hypothetical protein
MADMRKTPRAYNLIIAMILIAGFVTLVAAARNVSIYKPPPIATPNVVFRANDAERLPMPLEDWQYDADQMLLFSNGNWEGVSIPPSVGLYDWRKNELRELPIPNLNPLNGYRLAQSPDSHLIAYSTGGVLHLYNVISGTSITLTQGDDPAFSPDGKRVSIWRDNRLIALDFESFREEVLYESPDIQRNRDRIVSVCCTTWNPISTKIAFNIETEVDSQDKGLQRESEKVVILDLPTRQETVVGKGEFLGAPAWSPDGRLITYINYPGRSYSELRLIVPEEKCVVGSLPLSTISDSFWPPPGDVIAITDGGGGLNFVNVERVFGERYTKLKCPE